MSKSNPELRISVRWFPEIADAEAEALRMFTERNKPNDMMFGWLKYRRHNDMQTAYVALVWLGEQLVSWAAVVPGGHMIALAGALTDRNCQRRGYGRRALDAVLRHVAGLDRFPNGAEVYTHINYVSAGEFFHPAIVAAGFGDFKTNPEEYRARYHNRPR